MISKFPIIDVAGNHDVWAVDSLTSKENKFLDNSFIFNRSSIKNENDFIIKKLKIFNLTFILFNDYRFPVPRPPYGNEPYTNREQLDLLENMIDELENEECFILTHYNVDRMWFITSSKGHNFEEIISKKNVYAIFVLFLYQSFHFRIYSNIFYYILNKNNKQNNVLLLVLTKKELD